MLNKHKPAVPKKIASKFTYKANYFASKISCVHMAHCQAGAHETDDAVLSRIRLINSQAKIKGNVTSG